MNSFSDHRCKECGKRLLKGLYITLSNHTHDKVCRYCYTCQKKLYGLDFWSIKPQGSHCFYCNVDLFKNDLFDHKKYYIFTDITDGTQIMFCDQCFEDNSPRC